MKTILLPTDFSDNAENALYYAIELAKREKASIILLNAYMADINSPDSQENDLAEAENFSLNKLKNLSTKIDHAGGINYELISEEGSPVKVILKTAKKKNADLIIMGTKGETDLFSVVFGSNTANVFAKATIPVIAVPKEASYKAIKRITYATNYNQSDVEALNKLLEIARPYNAQVNLLHIANEKQSPQEEKMLMERFMEQVNSKLDYNNLSFQMLCSDDLAEELRDYLESGATDLLVMSTHHGGFIDKLFGESLTREVSKFTTVPVMIFHHNKFTAVKLFV